ncbi:MAG: glycoside hydrolase family 43 protein [Acidimicrobiales bacterium]
MSLGAEESRPRKVVLWVAVGLALATLSASSGLAPPGPPSIQPPDRAVAVGRPAPDGIPSASAPAGSKGSGEAVGGRVASPVATEGNPATDATWPPTVTTVRTARAPSVTPTTAPSVVARSEPDRSAPAQTASTESQGALWPGDFPDPSVLKVGPVYYAYSTEVGLDAVPTIRSVDLVHWSYVGDALAALPAWSGGTDVWAPSVVASAVGYVMFYATRDTRTGDQCISRAVSTSPTGPFVDASVHPFVCQLDQGGDIDPDAFLDGNGQEWLIWKSQGTQEGQPPRLWAQPLARDWTSLTGHPTAILGVSQRWEGSVVEAPAMVNQGGHYFLLYSGNNWDSASYAIGYAVCQSVVGPCSKPDGKPVLSSHGTEAGPGSPGLFYDGAGQLKVAYHAWTTGHVGYPGGARSLHIGTVEITGTRLSIQG